MRRSSAVAALLASVAAVLALCTGTAAAAAGEGEFVARANAARTAAGVHTLAVRSDLTSVARRHAERMAARRDIWHNPALGTEVTGWEHVGENVGVGGTVEVIHQAFMDSPAHRANILDRDYTEVGIGTAIGGDGNIYVVQVFRDPVAARTTTTVTSAPARRRPPVAATAPAPKPVRKAAPAPRRLDLVLAARQAATAGTTGALPQAVSFAETLRALAS